MRLDKYLAETAQCTRSEAKTLLQKGKVTVNGTLCKKGTPSSGRRIWWPWKGDRWRTRSSSTSC